MKSPILKNTLLILAKPINFFSVLVCKLRKLKMNTTTS